MSIDTGRGEERSTRIFAQSIGGKLKLNNNNNNNNNNY